MLKAGDMSTLSFHATKVYNTLEGGALVMHDEKTKHRIDYLKNFGFAGETEVVAPGINSKVDEVRSAYGLLNLKQVDQAIAARQKVAQKYRELCVMFQASVSLMICQAFVITTATSPFSSMHQNMARLVTSSTLR